MKTMKMELDQAKEKRDQAINDMKELQEKIKALKGDVTRKDQTIKDLQRKVQAVKGSMEQHSQSVDTVASEELEVYKRKFKDLKTRSKTDLDIKENQIRALKSKVESLSEQVEETQSEISSASKDMPM